MILNRIKNFVKKFSIRNRYRIKTHKNFSYLYYFKKEKFYRKLANKKEGAIRLKEEFKGFKWYCKLTKKNYKKIIKRHYFEKKNAYLDIHEIEGYKLKSWRPLTKNYKHILRFYYYYKKNFPKSKTYKIHGDLTLDNIILNKKDFFIIDWEFFGVKKKPRGYDLAYLFLSSICLPYLIEKKISLDDEKLFIELWKLLYKDKIDRKIIFDPFNYFERNIQKEKFFKESLKLSKSKFFPFLINNKIKKNILKTISKNFI
jgi:hypothetical protein